MEKLLFLVPLLPFLGFLANGFAGRRLPREAVSIVGCAAPGLAFLLALVGFFRVVGADEEALPLRNDLGDWIRAGELTVPFAFSIDRLSAVMALVVTGVGTLIHVYSVGYMRDDPGYPRFFAFLNLFMAAMLVLVLADNIVLLFLGWEGVGLCSYLLIGFWYRDLANCGAAIKAFVVNRIGDLAFLLGIFWIFVTFGTFDFTGINEAAPEAAAAGSSVFWIALLLFIGATGKSAQIPLHVWLPDAMAGPTPVSALIHAATMVTSGVYMVARLGGLYLAAPDVLLVVATVGAFTALLAAAIAFAQHDIKKVLAYSTVSQLGYMFLAAGVGAYGVAVFHLVTHAFFKALLFLAAGAVIVSLHHEQDMRRMGGLKDRVPHTAVVFTVGALALAGFPITAGFFSKDEIIHVVHDQAAHGEGFRAAWLGFLWVLALITALMTACYIFRQVSLVFFGSYRGARRELEDEDEARSEETSPGGHHGHAPLEYEEIEEAPLIMRIPLYILAFLSVLGGLLGVPHFLEIGLLPGEEGKLFGWLLGTVISVAGITLGVGLYLRRRDILEKITEGNFPGRRLKALAGAAFHIDDLYRNAFVRPLFVTAEILYHLVDRFVIDFVIVGGTGFFLRGFGSVFRRLQSGKVPAYAMIFFCGVLVILVITWWHLLV